MKWNFNTPSSRARRIVCLLVVKSQSRLQASTYSAAPYKSNLRPALDEGVVLLPKENSKLRPIALASIVLKNTESMILVRVNHYIENNGFLPSFQNGFRKGRSCQHSLAAFKADIHQSFLSKKSLCAVLLEIKFRNKMFFTN